MDHRSNPFEQHEKSATLLNVGSAPIPFKTWSVDSSTGTIFLRPGTLHPGGSVHVHLPKGEPRSAMFVPAERAGSLQVFDGRSDGVLQVPNGTMLPEAQRLWLQMDHLVHLEGTYELERRLGSKAKTKKIVKGAAVAVTVAATLYLLGSASKR